MNSGNKILHDFLRGRFFNSKNGSGSVDHADSECELYNFVSKITELNHIIQFCIKMTELYQTIQF